MFKNLIIADDFTGSNDTGMQLQRKGYEVNVYLKKPAAFPENISVVWDTETRSMDPEDAYRKVKQDLEEMDLSVYKYVIKKTDSLLRGNIPQEVKAVDEILGSDLVIFIAALPDLGRTTVNGIHLFNGVPISETEMAHDPVKPVLVDNIQVLLQQAYTETVFHISLSDIDEGALDFSKGRVFTADARTNAQMQAVIRAALDTGRKTLFVGTAAMADNILALEDPGKPALGLVTSVSNVTRDQVHQAAAAQIPIVNVKVPELLEKKAEEASYVKEALEYLTSGKDVLIISSATYDRNELDRTLETAGRLGLSREKANEETLAIIGRIGKEVIDQVEVAGLFLAGGDTSMSFFRMAGAEGSEIIGEIAAGIPLMKMAGGAYPGMKVVTKSGAFGNPDAIVYSLRKLKA